MRNDIRKILKVPCENISAVTGVDEYSKKIDLLDHALMMVQSAIYHKDLTDLAMDNSVSKSQLSKLDTGRPYQVFVELFYNLVYPYIMAHNYSLYSRFLNIIGIDSTFIRTAIAEPDYAGMCVCFQHCVRGILLYPGSCTHDGTVSHIP